MNSMIQLKRTVLVPIVSSALACFAFSATARAVCQDGCFAVGNTALGDDALSVNQGQNNTAVGNGALKNNTSGGANTAVGDGGLENNTTGVGNTATGTGALFGNTTGNVNTANGQLALLSNTTGSANTAVGDEALAFNTNGSENTANGVGALQSNTSGSDNTATGRLALASNTTGNGNIAVGHGAGVNLTSGINNIDIGSSGVAGESSTIRIGTAGTHTATFIAGVSGAGVTGMAVKINAAGQLGTAPSSARFKDEIKPMDKVSEALLALKPVSFRYKKEIDPVGTSQFGLVAEDVEKVNPDLVVRDKEGKPYTVRYDAVNAMLLNEFLKEHRTIQEQQKEIDALKAELKEQRALIQKVNDKVELNKPAPQMVVNDQ